ncbi:MAG: ABC-F family ATP-binding cassette domain-containing protein, partial [Roseburia sp.]|nr:ABC-F family ATP-binding cassette domain-containing protein [Roseburia sp.]
MIQIKNLTITHRKDLRTIVNDFSMVLNEGDKAALIGEEGNGKSTLLKLIYDETLVEDYVEYTGEIIKNGARIGYLAQELAAAQKEMTIYEFFSQSEIFYDLTPRELGDIAARLVLPSDIFYSDQQVGQLSGGEKVKLQLAKILMEQPDVLLLDEPSNDLDIRTLEWLENFIREVKLPLLYISHDELLLERTANKIIHLEQIKRKTESRYTIAAMGYEEYVERRNSGLAHQEQVARKERSEYEKQQERFRQIQQKVEHQQNAITRQDPHGGQLLKKKMHAVKSMERRFEKEYENMTEIPETEDAIFIKFGEKISMPNGKRVLELQRNILYVRSSVSLDVFDRDAKVDSMDASDGTSDHVENTERMLGVDDIQEEERRILARNIHLSVTGPEHVCIIGRNGVGKTTLLREIATELLKRTDIHAFYMPQNYEEILPMEQTPVDFLCETGDKDEISRVRTYLGSMKYTADEMSHPVAELSGGQKAKLLLLKMSMAGCDVLILDEPTRNFSPLS